MKLPAENGTVGNASAQATTERLGSWLCESGSMSLTLRSKEKTLGLAEPYAGTSTVFTLANREAERGRCGMRTWRYSLRVDTLRR